MKNYLDITIFSNPIAEYFKWIGLKLYYQIKYWGKHLRIGYGSYVRRTSFGKYNYIGKNVIIGDCEIGDFSYISHNTTINQSRIGKFCSIGPDVKFAPGKHPTSGFVSTHPSLFSNPGFLKKNFTTQSVFEGNARVTIGNDVWIGANSIVLDGVTIGDGAVVAANSVVNKDVEPYHIVGGSPAKFIKKRFDDDEIKKLVAFKWWDKDEDWIQQNIQSFWDIKNFVKL